MGLPDKKKKIFDGRYEVQSIVGRGSCSVVYQARHTMSPSSEVALKVLLENKNNLSNSDRLRKEALALVSSRHKYVVRLDDFHSVGDLCYLSLEFAPEFDLRKFSQKKGGRLPANLAEIFLRQAAEALDFIHHVGIIHRDIKPDNILVMNEKEIRLADFGVAVLPGDDPGADGAVGTMSYMAPEILDGDPCSKSSDLYALGLSFYEMLSGQHPFDQLPLMKQLEAREPENFPHLADLVPEIPDYLAGIIMRCLAYDSRRRFTNGRDLVQNLLRNRTYAAPGRAPGLNVRPAKEEATKLLQAVDNNDQLAAAKQTPVDIIEAPLALEPDESPAEVNPQEKGMSFESDENEKTEEVKQKDKPEGNRSDRKPALFASYKPNRGSGRKRSGQPESGGSAAQSPSHPASRDQEDGESSALAPEAEASQVSGHQAERPRSDEGRSSRRPTRRVKVADNEAEEDQAQPAADAHVAPASEASELTRKPTLVMDRQTVSELTESAAKDASKGIAPSESKLDQVVGAPPKETFNPNELMDKMSAASEIARDRLASGLSKAQAIGNQLGDKIKSEEFGAKADKSKMMKLVKLLGLGFVGLLIVYKLSSGGPEIVNEVGDQPVAEQKQLSSSPIPAPQGGSLSENVSFPLLPQGLYSGGVEGLFPNKSLPLAMIAFADGKRLSVVIGLEGWTPAMIDLEPFHENGAHAGSNTLRISSNGFVLDFTGQKVNNEIVGTFRNTITGEQGEWRVAPQS